MIETKNKRLIVCPTCELQGVKSILGEVGTNGNFIVQRFHQGSTIINAPTMSAICGKCFGTAFIKHEGTIPNPWGAWVHRESVTISFRGTTC